MALDLFPVDPAQQLRAIVFVEPLELDGDGRFGRPGGIVPDRSTDSCRQDKAQRARQFEMTHDLFIRLKVVITLKANSASRDVDEPRNQ